MSKSKTSESILTSEAVDRLTIAVEESARAANIQNPRFVEPAQGTLNRARAKRHHIVFGRRGSGKTSLLAKAAADLTVDRRPIAFVNLETFKGHSYPDVLLSVLIESLAEFEKWFATAATAPANRTSFWRRLFGTKPSRGPLEARGVEKLLERVRAQREELRSQLHAPDHAEIQRTTEHADRQDATTGAKVGATAPLMAAELSPQAPGSRRGSSRPSTPSAQKAISCTGT